MTILTILTILFPKVAAKEKLSRLFSFSQPGFLYLTEPSKLLLAMSLFSQQFQLVVSPFSAFWEVLLNQYLLLVDEY